MTMGYKITAAALILVAFAFVSLAIALSRESPCPPAPDMPGGPDLMKAVVHRCYGAPDVLRLENVEKPVPKDDEVLVRVRAAAVNPLDWHFMRGRPYVMRMGAGLGAPTTTRFGVDFSGTVEAVGRNVTLFRPGDEVFGGRTGAFGEYVTVRESRAIVPKPANVTFEQAASVPVAAITALQALRDQGQIRAGQKVLINGASGGVGTFAVQIARSFGAEVTGVCSTRNVEMVRSIGADHVIDYRKANYTEGGQRYDLIVDMIGNHGLLENRRALQPGGKYVMVGGPDGKWVGPMTGFIKVPLLDQFVSQQFRIFISEFTKEDLELLARLMQEGKMTPVIDRRYTLEQVPEAIRYLEAGHARGKVVITLEPA